MKNILLLSILMLGLKSTGQDCKNISQHFSSYKEAVKEIKSAKFKVKEDADVSESLWIRSATYYSCDGQKGYFIYTTNKGYEYVHKNVPISLWEGFKNASSKGSYYDHTIKGRYKVLLN